MKMIQKIMSAAALLLPMYAVAGEVEILDASFSQQSDKSWSVSVTLQHADTGWENYADAWRVVAGKDTVLGTRTLVHPHVNEQPFTRSLSPVKIPADTTTIYIEAHDLVHGWSSQRLEINLLEAREGRLKVNR